MNSTKIVIIYLLLFIITTQLGCSDKFGKNKEGKNNNAAGIEKFGVDILQQISDSVFVEKNFANSLSSNNSTIKLIGFKRINLTDLEVSQIKDLIKNNVDKFSKKNNYYFSEKGKFLRIYFPLHTAIVRLKNIELHANHLGLVSTNQIPEKNQLTLVGRERSDLVRGTGTNIINGNKILLKKILTYSSANFEQNYYVFDLGKRSFGVNGGHSCCSRNAATTTVNSNNVIQSLIIPYVADDEGKVSCYQNHGNQNCSTAFNINEGRCTFQANICMDYNGWFTDCINGKVSNFPGSDCDKAIGRGHCWNEIME